MNNYAMDRKGIHYNISEHAINKHELYAGPSGSGKTSGLMRRQIALAKLGIPIVSLAFHGAGQRDGMDPELRGQYEELVQTKKVKSEGIALPMWETFDQGYGVEIARTLARAFSLTSSREKMLRVAAESAAKDGSLEHEGISAVIKSLADIDSHAADEAFIRLTPLLQDIPIINGGFESAKPILELDFSGLLLEDQTQLVQFCLDVILRSAERGKFLQDGLAVVVDEFQSLSTDQGSAMRDLLEIGRKQNLRFLLATPELPFCKTSASYLAMQQCATTAFFRPGIMEQRKLARIIEPRKAVEWQLELNKLRRGEFVAFGQMETENGIPVHGPIIMHM